MQIHNLVQGSPEWCAFRLEHFGASEAAAMLGLSKKVKRTELLHMKHTGIAKEYSDWLQKNVLDKGHEVEALARPIVEKMIDDDLYPVTCSDGKLSASCDGLTMSYVTAWENKQWNTEYAEMVRNGILPEEHAPQCYQILRITRAQKVVFSISDGTEENTVTMDVLPDQEWFDRIDAGWAQFEKDLAEYVEPEVIDTPQAEAIMSLPAVVIQVSGALTNCNLDDVTPKFDLFLAKAEAGKTSIDIPNGTAIAKFSRDAAADCKLTAKAVVSQMATVSDAVNKLELYAKKFDAMGLLYEKEVDRLKEIEKVAALNKAKAEYAEYCAVWQAKILPITLVAPVVDFAFAIKGLKTVESKNNALNVALANGKIAVDAVAKDILAKQAWLKDNATGHSSLFPDLQSLIVKPMEDFTLTITSRIEKQKADEAARLATERERMEAEAKAKAEREAAAKLAAEEARIRAEEQAKARAEAEARAQSESEKHATDQEYKPNTPDRATTLKAAIADAGTRQIGADFALSGVAADGKEGLVRVRPTRDDLINTIADAYGVDHFTAMEWLESEFAEVAA